MKSQDQNDRTHRMAALVFAVLGVAAVGLPACSTIEGAGEDMEYVGESISGASEDAQNDD